jgi:hypothetical protein
MLVLLISFLLPALVISLLYWWFGMFWPRCTTAVSGITQAKSLMSVPCAAGSSFHVVLVGGRPVMCIRNTEIIDGHATLPQGVTSVDEFTFHGCQNLRSVTIPSSVECIGHCAFEGCSALNSVTIPPSVTHIGQFAFLGCSSLSSVTIPSSVTNIELSAFKLCNALTSVTIPSTAEVDDSVFPKETTIVRLPPARMLAQEHLFFLGQSLLAYKRSRSRIFAWLERSQIRMGAYAPGGAARQRDREAYVKDGRA